jgi:hypothetical protein
MIPEQVASMRAELTRRRREGRSPAPSLMKRLAKLYRRSPIVPLTPDPRTKEGVYGLALRARF